MSIFPGKFTYFTMLLIILADVCLLWVTGLRLSLDQFLRSGLTVLLFAACVAWIGRVSPSSERAERLFHRTSCLMQGMIFLLLGWIAVRVLNHASMRTSIEHADAKLAGWDTTLGLDWPSYFEFVRGSPLLRTLMDHSYTSLSLLSFVSFLALMLYRDTRRAGFFLEGFFFTAVICTVIGMFFPAKAAVATYLGENAVFSDFNEPPGLYHLAHMEALRGNAVHALDLANMPGLVTFPSFHTAAGIILMAGFWRTWLLWPIAIYSVVMIASTPVFGGHYFVDLFAGAAIALAIVGVLSSLPRYRNLFSVGSGTDTVPVVIGEGAG